MIPFIIVLLILASIILVGFVLIQNPKGGGLGSTFGGLSNNMFGVQRTTDFLERATWGFAIGVFVLCLSTSMFKPRTTGTETLKRQESAIEKDLKGATPSVPAAPQQQQPAQQQKP